MLVSFLLMMIAIVTATILPLNGQTTGNVPDSYTILAFPSKYVFLVVILVYLSILYWFYKQWQIVRNKQISISILQTFLFSLAMLLQIVWIYYWHQEMYITSGVFSIISALLLTVFYMLLPIKNTLSQRIPISLLLAWFVILVSFNFAVILTYNYWEDFIFSTPLWTVILLTFIAAVALHIRFHHHDPYFPLLFIWFYLGIAIHNNFDELLVSTAALFLSGALIAAMLFLRKKVKPNK